MTRTRAVAALLILLMATFSACGGDSGPGPHSGIDRSKTVGSLDPNEAATLCDWASARQGGYGRSVSCPGSQQRTDSSKESCVSGLPLLASYCPSLTVGETEDCANAIGTDLCALETAPECATIWACMTS